jgi:hypothetical protein
MTDIPDPILRDTLRLARLPDEDDLDAIREEQCGDPCYGCPLDFENCTNCRLK